MSKHTHISSPALPQLKPLVQSILSLAQRPSALALALGAMPALALAQMPTGGKVVAGSATISNPDGSHTVIEQSSDKAILNWQSFSISQGGHVQFIQRDSNAVALNRVVGSDPSAILGHLSANGQIFLVNQNGIFFGQSAVVDVAGIVATTLDIKDEDFMRGDYRFARGANAPERATVINQGALNANGGYVVLAGDYVANQGVVAAQLGTVLLASGDALTLQMAGSSLINYQVDKATVAHLAGVENSGQILANGGRVIMTAEVAQDLAATVVNNSGLIQAQSTVERDGAVYFEGKGGNVANSGSIDASAQAGANGGHVEIRASGDIAHEAGSTIDVSGADTGASDAGSVMTWADGTNRYKEGAAIVARGGAEGGDGGDVELSGNKVLNRSIVDLRAPNGELGTLTLDPTAITIADGAGLDAEDQATVYEQNIEAQLRVGNVNLTAIGEDASITVSSLSDGVLDGSNNGAGGSLSLRASGAGNPTIRFANRDNTIKVDGDIEMTTGHGEDSVTGTIDVGHLEAGTRIALESGSIRAAGLKVARNIATQSDTSFDITARAHGGDLAVDGDVNLDVTNTAAGALTTSVSLRADNGNVSVGGAVNSNATGLGYYNYNWTTAGNEAPTYFGQQPWSLVSQADHPIVARLDIQASGTVKAGSINVLSTDRNTAFDANVGGYWQTANATQHNFWRPTGALASGAIAAGGDVAIAGKTSVKADGYAVSAYSEVESWRTMVDNFNYTSGSQTVYTNYGCVSSGSNGCTDYDYRSSYVYTDNRLKGSPTGNYIWQFGEYTSSLPGVAYNSPDRSSATDSSGGFAYTNMGYSGVAGMSATLDVNAGGSVSMNGMEVRSTNHSSTGGSSFNDKFWGFQDTANGLNDTPSSFTSASRETDYYDTFDTSYTASSSTARANISAGDNASVTLNGGAGYDVVAEHPLLDAAGNSLAHASMSVSAGTAGGATGNGLISIQNGVNVRGASGNDVSLSIVNHDGAVDLADTPVTVTNTYDGGDARALVQADNGQVDLESIAVNAGHSAWLDVKTSADLTVDGAASALVTGPASSGTAAIRMDAAGEISTGDLIATSNHGGGLIGIDGPYADGGTASIDVNSSGGDIDLRGDVRANGYRSATIDAAASGAGKTLVTAAGKTVATTTTGGGYNGYNDYLASTTLSADSALDIHGDVEARVINRNGAASVALGTTGGANATITQDAGTRILADGNSASVRVDAGAVWPDASNAAVAQLQGSVSAQSSNGAATIAVNAASGTVHDFSANSSANVAAVTINTFDAAGKLVVDGSGTVNGNVNAPDGATLSIDAAGAVDTSAAPITVANNNYNDYWYYLGWGGNAGARATIAARNGDALLGAVSVNASNSATLAASASGELLAGGALAATANGGSGSASVSLAADGKLVIADGAGSAAARMNGGSGSASVNLDGAGGIELGGNLTASAVSGEATVRIGKGGKPAQLQQDAGTTILATGASGIVDIDTGAGAFDLRGEVQARANSGQATIVVNGASGTLQDFSAISSFGAASAAITAANGMLDFAGAGVVNGYNGATLNANASGDLTVREMLAANQTGPFGAAAQVNLSTAGGALLLDTGASLHASAQGMDSTAGVSLSADKDMRIDGTVNAVSMAGNASADLVTTGGSAAAITQAADSAIRASGNTANVRINAGNAWPDASNGAALSFAGTVDATATVGSASVSIQGAGGTVHDVNADSAYNSASVTLGATDAGGSLVLDGKVRAAANIELFGGASVYADAAGTLDSSAADISASNVNTGMYAGAAATLNAGADLQLGSVNVSGATATVNADAGADLGVAKAMSVTATGAYGRAEAVLGAGGSATVASGASVNANANHEQASSRVIIVGGQDLAIAGQLTASAGGYAGQSGIDLLARNGDIAIDAALNSVAGDRAGIALDAGGDIALNASLNAFASHNAVAGVSAANGGLTQAAGTVVQASANEGLAQVQLASGGAMALDGAVRATATGDHLQGGTAIIDIATTGGAPAAITQGKDGLIEAVGAAANVIVHAGDNRPADDLARAASFDLGGAVHAYGNFGGASVEIAGASGSVNELRVSATDAPAIATINAMNGDLRLDGSASVSGMADNHMGANLEIAATGALDTSGASVTVANTGGGASANAMANLHAWNGATTLGQTSVTAEGGSAYLFASAGDSLNLPSDLRATSAAGDAVVDLSTNGGASSSITQAAGSTVAASGNYATVGISAGSHKYGDGAALALGGDVQARASTGSARISISGASGSVHGFSAESAGNTASVSIDASAADGSLVLDGRGSVIANTDAYQGAYLSVNGAGALDTSAAALTVANHNGGATAYLNAGGNATLGQADVRAGTAASLNGYAGGKLDVTGALTVDADALAANAQLVLAAAGSTHVAANAALVASAANGWANIDITGDQGATVDGGVFASGGDAAIRVAAAGGDIALNGQLDAQARQVARVGAQALGGELVQATGSTLRSASTEGSADLYLESQGAMTVGGSLNATAATDARVDLATTGGAGASITQDAASSIEAAGNMARLSLAAGNGQAGYEAGDTAAFQLDGSLRASGNAGGAGLLVSGAEGSVHDFSVTAGDADTSAAIVTFKGDLSLDGAGLVSSNGAYASGASLRAQATGALDTSGATVQVQSAGVDLSAGAEALLIANGGAATIGQTSVSAFGGAASLAAVASGALALPADLSATSVAGDATVVAATMGGEKASIVQAAGSTIRASGNQATVFVSAGNAMSDAAGPADVVLGGDVQASAMFGSASIEVTGANASVHDFGAHSAAGSASVTIAGMAANGSVTLDGKGSVSANADGAEGARLKLSSAGAIDTAAAELVVDNAYRGEAAGAAAELVANGGDNLLGDLSVTGTRMSTLVASASGKLDATGALSATAVAGDAQLNLAAGATTTVAANASVDASATKGSAGVNVSGDQGVTVDGQLAATGINAGIDLAAAGGNVAVNGKLSALAVQYADIDVRAAAGSLTQAAGSVIRSGATEGIAQVDLSSHGAMALDGNVLAAATANGDVDGEHTGAALVGITTTGGSNAAITQDKASTIEAVGRAARLSIEAGAGESVADSAAFQLDGALRAIDDVGGSSLDVTGASGSVHDFTVTAGDASANAVITARNGELALNGTGTVIGNADQAGLQVQASGSLDTSAATLSVTNLTGAASAELTAQNGNNVLGNVSVTGGSAALDASASGKLDVTGALSTTAVAGEAQVNLAAGATTTVAATASLDAAATNGSAGVNVSGNQGVTVNGQLGATGAEAGIDLAAAGGNVAVNGKLTALAGRNADIDVRAVAGSLTQGAGSVIRSGATEGVAQVDLSSHGAMAINGNIVAAATANGNVDGAHTGGALVGITTTGGAGSTVTQAKASTIEAVGRAARLSIEAGAGESVADSAAFKLDGSLRAIDAFGGSSLDVTGASGSVHDFTVTAGDASANAVITARNGDLSLNGSGTVIGNADSASGANLEVQASGALDTRAADLAVSNLSTGENAGAQATLLANNGGNVLGSVSVTGGVASLDATASGKLDVTGALSATAVAGSAQVNLAGGSATTIAANASVDVSVTKGSAGIKASGDQGLSVNGQLGASGADANIDLAAASGNVALNGKLTALAGQRAEIDVRAAAGSLTQAAGSVIRSGATEGIAQVDLSSHGAMAINGNVIAAATANGNVDGAHTGGAVVGITTTGGAGSSVTQDKASTIEAVGRAARLSIEAGGDTVADSAAFKLDGSLRAIDAIGGSSLEIAGASGSVHDFTVTAGDASANAVITARNGDLSLNGSGTVIANADSASGANLELQASGSLDTTGATIEVGNTGRGDQTGAQASLLAQAGDAKLGAVSVKAQGGGAAALLAQAGNTMSVNSQLGAENLGLGNAAGSASITLKTTGTASGTSASTITQEAGATIAATSFGTAGDATVDIQAGNCCNSAVVLNDSVKAVVTGGTGSAAVAVRGNLVTAKDVTANVVAGGSGNALVSLAAPTELKLGGSIDAQAGSGARADVKLISDLLTDNATFKLSTGNGHVQLSSFDTRRMIGVHSDKDFDATSDTNYVLATLQKFVGQGAELSFGGEFDRSAWTNGSPADTCVPGMDAWASQLQHTGEIHVAGNGRLDLGDVKMVFDTTGSTIYHDPKMSAWSVPTGRVATLIVPPSNVDRYLDRTDNTLQNMNKVVQDTSNNPRSMSVGDNGPAVRGTQITGKLFMDGNGVNMVRNDAATGSQADAQASDSDSRDRDSATEE